jgi:hypothetical protein
MRFYGLIFSVLIIMQSCNVKNFRANYTDLKSLKYDSDHSSKKMYLKAHMINLDLYIFKDKWEIDTLENVIVGEAVKYNYNRKIVDEGVLKVNIDSVAIFETNKKINHSEIPRLAALTIFAGVNAYVAYYCYNYPKACYGSCPTFYVGDSENVHYADAEGFSKAIVPSMEYVDIDALNNGLIQDREFEILMKNEALETHCVKEVKLLAYPRKEGERVYHDAQNEFYLCKNVHPIKSATSEEGNITDLLANEDKKERYSLSDEKNLKSKEEIILTFYDIDQINDLGFILSFRQSLMTTYLFYSTMGYMGDRVGDSFAKLELDSNLRVKFDKAVKLLGGIDVYVWDNRQNKWVFQGEFWEAGPIAVNKQILPIKGIDTEQKDIKIKLELNKGLWRIDYVALTNIVKKVEPLVFNPVRIETNGSTDNKSLNNILDENKYLFSMPGDAYRFTFDLEKSGDYELFLHSKGYYLEWMRTQWLTDKNFYKLRQTVDNPQRYYKTEAKRFKVYEKHMEHEFWNSKVNHKIFDDEI